MISVPGFGMQKRSRPGASARSSSTFAAQAPPRAPRASRTTIGWTGTSRPHVNVLDYRALKRKAGSEDKRLAVYSGAWHGWDLLYKAPFRSQVDALVLGFLNKYSGNGE